MSAGTSDHRLGDLPAARLVTVHMIAAATDGSTLVPIAARTCV